MICLVMPGASYADTKSARSLRVTLPAAIPARKTEAYDCASVFLAGMGAGKVTRADLAAFVSAYDAPGITKQIKFDATGEPVGNAVYYSVVESGKIVAKGLIK